MNFKTEQESFWAGEFGDKYISRNNSKELIASNIFLFSQISKSLEKDTHSFLELGANIGLNIWALKILHPNAKFTAVEINKTAAEELKKIDDLEVKNQSILDLEISHQYDFVFSKGVLIHINPSELDTVYKKMYDASKKYICVCEYYNPVPTEVVYRGETGKLFKRDFAGELLSKYKDLKLIDYGFVYHGDNHFMQDDATWFLLKK